MDDHTKEKSAPSEANPKKWRSPQNQSLFQTIKQLTTHKSTYHHYLVPHQQDQHTCFLMAFPILDFSVSSPIASNKTPNQLLNSSNRLNLSRIRRERENLLVTKESNGNELIPPIVPIIPIGLTNYKHDLKKERSSSPEFTFQINSTQRKFQ